MGALPAGAFLKMPMQNDTPVKRRLLLFVSLDVELTGVDTGSGGEDALGDGGE